MSLISRCPACATLFSVVPDQLKISEGWVRCGKCAEVFDASENLIEDVAVPVTTHAPATAATPAISPPSAQADESKQAEPGTMVPDHVKAESAKSATLEATDTTSTQNLRASLQASPEFDPMDFVAPDSAAFIKSASDLTDDEAQLLEELQAFKNAQAAETWDSKFSNDSQNPRSQSHGDSATGTADEEDLTDAEATPTFVRDAQRAALWQSGWVRGLLGVLAFALTGVLGLQIAVQERDRIAALEPRAVPWLQDLCRPLECNVSALQQIESIVVDASSFNKLRADARQESYMLNVSLKNTAGMPVALPHVELSLNDVQDQSVVRRVLKPADLGATSASLAAGAEFAGGVAVQVDSTQLGGARIAGYRVLAFYP